MLLFGQETKTLKAGEDTGATFEVQGDQNLLPGNYDLSWLGAKVIVPDYVKPGVYSIVAKGGTGASLATFSTRNVQPPGPFYQTAGQVQVLLTIPDGVWIGPADYDIV